MRQEGAIKRSFTMNVDDDGDVQSAFDGTAVLVSLIHKRHHALHHSFNKLSMSVINCFAQTTPLVFEWES